jgi:hydroxysqualene dehydroxylase
MHGDAAGRALDAAGVEVRTGARVDGIEENTAVLADGERIPGDAFVVAVPPDAAAHVLDQSTSDYRYSPIVSVHLHLDRVVLDQPLAALLGSPAHWVFDRGRLTGRMPKRGQYLTVVSSGVPELLELRGRELVETIADAVTSRLGSAELLWSRVSREPRATVAQEPLSRGFRPVISKRKNVVLAGTWDRGPWPATMEGAVRCGRLAASRLLTQIPEYAR